RRLSTGRSPNTLKPRYFPITCTSSRFPGGCLSSCSSVIKRAGPEYFTSSAGSTLVAVMTNPAVDDRAPLLLMTGDREKAPVTISSRPTQLAALDRIIVSAGPAGTSVTALLSSLSEYGPFFGDGDASVPDARTIPPS